jgi:signal transduction histidine kinase
MARRLFTIGLQLSGVLKLTTGTEVYQRIEAAIEEADSAISELRRAVFSSGRQPGQDQAGTR